MSQPTKVKHSAMVRLVILILSLSLVALAADLKKSDRIYGGEEVTPNSVPYMVALRVRKSGGITSCGGSIISRNFILTSARCVYGYLNVEIIAGAHDIGKNEDTQKRYNTTFVIIHEEYKRKSTKNDIALVEFPKEVYLQDNLRKVGMLKLSEENIDLVGQTGQAYGWGDTASGSTTTLQMADLEILPLDKCKDVYGPSMNDKQLCLKGDKKNFCKGDEGGPIVIDGKQVGIMSIPYFGDCSGDFPSIATRVSKYLKWIKSHSDVKFEK